MKRGLWVVLLWRGLAQAEELPPSAFSSIPETTAQTIEQSGVHPSVILIEDAHNHPEAQGRIAALLVHVFHRWNTRQVLVEGAFREVAPPFPLYAADRGDRTVRQLLEEGRLPGSELAATMLSLQNARLPMVLRGMDNAALYRGQLAVFRELLRRRAAVPESKWVQTDPSVKALVELRMTALDHAHWRRHPVRVVRALQPAVEAAEAFYRLSDERTMYFFQRIRNEGQRGPVAVVTGGFHAPLLRALLRRQGVSFVALRPRIDRPRSRARYLERLNQTLETLKQPQFRHAYSPALYRLRLGLSRRKFTSSTAASS